MGVDHPRAPTGGGMWEPGVRQLFASEINSSPPTSEVGGTVLDPIESEGPEGVPKATTIPEGRRTGEMHFLKQSPGLP